MLFFTKQFIQRVNLAVELRPHCNVHEVVALCKGDNLSKIDKRDL